jgi:serine/threonine-protein kinase SRPK3
MSYHSHRQVPEDASLYLVDILNCEDLKADNFMLVFEEKGVIDDYVKNLEKDPPPCEERDGRPIYASRPDFGPLRCGRSRLKISDFGRAVFGDKSPLYYHKIQPVQFSAPEVLLKAGWTYSADIWNMGMVVSTLTGVAFYLLQ